MSTENKKRLILASGSPRRKMLMEAMGLTFEVIPSQFEEHLDDSRAAEDVAIELGLGKALDVATQFPAAYVVGGDSIVVIDGRQLEKPVDEAESRMMLHSLSGRVHHVVSSVVVVCIDEKVQVAKVALVEVTFETIPNDVIEAYIATGDPYDKAGGYARQHPLLTSFINTQGDRHAAMGLSTLQLRVILENNGITVPNDEILTSRNFESENLRQYAQKP